MKYHFYPGCSLERNASAYHESALAVADPLGLEFSEVADWNCCGATEVIAINKMKAYALVGRNLALAAQQSRNGEQLVTACSACFLNLSKGDKYLQESPGLAAQVNVALAAGGLHYRPGSVTTRHLLDVITYDIGFEAVARLVKKPLYGLRVAPYYGCLITRPGFLGQFDDYEYPDSLDRLLRVLGTSVVDFPLKTHCCGGHMTQISEQVALELIGRLLHNAAEHGADAIITLCPMCQLNLDAYQDEVNQRFGTSYRLPILYFTQLMGLAFGMSPEVLGFGKEFVPAGPALAKIGVEPPPVVKAERPSKTALPMPVMPEKE